MTQSPNNTIAMSPEDITLTFSFRGTSHVVSLPNDAPLSALHSRLEALTSVPSSLQKLIYRGKKIQHRQDVSEPEPTIAQAGLRDGVKVQMLGSTADELKQLNAADSARQSKERILRERALKPQVKVCLSFILYIYTMNHDETKSAPFHRFILIVFLVTPVPFPPHRAALSFATS
jgi:hypothetical protein